MKYAIPCYVRIVGSSNRQKQNNKFKTSIKSVRKYSFWYIYLWKTMPRCKIEKKEKAYWQEPHYYCTI